MVIIDFILHCDEYIGLFINDFGFLVYGILFLIIFCETGLVFLPFLPGDSLIFAGGTFAGIGSLNLWILFPLIILAAILGDSINYMIGKKFGKKLLNNDKFVIVKEENLIKADDLISKYGAWAVFLARFMPIIRTIVPFVVGMGKLDYKKFLMVNALGAVVWVSLFLLLGFFFGNIPVVADHFSLIIIGIVLISISPMIIALFKHKKTAD